jgi:mono/diheme cytochrome c family protein
MASRISWGKEASIMRQIVLMVMGAALWANPMVKAQDDTATLRAIGMGRAIYLTNCAQCHGSDARGAALAEPHHGQATSAPDLTTIASQDGRFDLVHVANLINGRPWGECTSTMPCWRHVSGYEQGRGPAYTQLQTWKLAKYLEFVQQAPPAPAPKATEGKGAQRFNGTGRALYLANCARCHGPDARGLAQAESQKSEVTSAPDLTTIASRDGRFDVTHVANHVNGRPWGECTADMPCWERLFRKTHGSAYAQMEVWNLAKYLESVQETAR